MRIAVRLATYVAAGVLLALTAAGLRHQTGVGFTILAVWGLVLSLFSFGMAALDVISAARSRRSTS